MEKEIKKILSEAGYKMLGDDKNVEKLILDILKTNNIRYLKTIPFIIYKQDIDIKYIHNANMNIMIAFSAIMTITKKIFQELNIKKKIPEHIHFKPKKIETYIKKRLINFEEFKTEFELQLRNDTKPNLFIEKQRIYAERDLQMYLSQIFTRKEKQIIRRMA